MLLLLQKLILATLGCGGSLPLSSELMWEKTTQKTSFYEDIVQKCAIKAMENSIYARIPLSRVYPLWYRTRKGYLLTRPSIGIFVLQHIWLHPDPCLSFCAKFLHFYVRQPHRGLTGSHIQSLDIFSRMAIRSLSTVGSKEMKFDQKSRKRVVNISSNQGIDLSC